MANKDILTDIKTKLDSVNVEMQNQWAALSTIAARLGFSMNEKGEYLMESDGADVPKLSQQTSDGTVASSAPPAPTMDVDTFAKQVVEDLRKNPPPVDLSKQKVSVDTYSLITSNKKLFDTITQPWNDWFNNFRKALLKLNGYKEVIVGDDVILAVDDNPAIPPNYLCEELASEPTNKPIAKRSMLDNFRHRIWQDMTSCFWKSFAYSIAVLEFIVCCCQWYENSKLTEPAEKYELFKLYYTIFPEHQEVYDNVNNAIKENGIDKVRENILQMKAEKQLEEYKRK